MAIVLTGFSLLFALSLLGCGGQGEDSITIRSGDDGRDVRSIEHGFLPTNITEEDAIEAYESWKEARLEDCGEGVFRVRWEDDREDATVSQGIGYGMLLTVTHGDKKAFDGLWQYYQLAMNERGLMHWLRHGCDAHRETTYNDYPDDAASDADLDVAMALILADCNWGGDTYASSARLLLESIRDYELIVEDGRTLLLGGDNSWFVDMGGGCVNPSYSAPGYYRYFAEFVNDEADKEIWGALADDTYALLNAAQDPATGLVPNWSNTLGESADCASAFECADDFGIDAARTSFRVATDYLWYGKAESKDFLDRTTNWATNEVGIEDVQVNYTLEGEVGSCEDKGGRIISVGSLANGAVSSNQETVNAFAQELKNLSADDYPEQALKALYLLQLSGKLTTCER